MNIGLNKGTNNKRASNLNPVAQQSVAKEKDQKGSKIGGMTVSSFVNLIRSTNQPLGQSATPPFGQLDFKS